MKEAHRILGGLEWGSGELALGYIKGLALRDNPSARLEIGSYEEAQGVGQCWEIDPDRIVALLDEGWLCGQDLVTIILRRRRHRRVKHG